MGNGAVRPRYYVSHAGSALEDVRRITKTGLVDAVTVNKELDDLKLVLEDAQCWYLQRSVLDTIWKTKITGDALDQVKLPAPAVALEYDFRNEFFGLPPVGEGKDQGEKRVVLAVEFANNVLEEDGFGVWFFFFSETIKDWVISPFCVYLSYKELWEPERWLPTRWRDSAVKRPSSDRPIHIDLKVRGLTNNLSLTQLANLAKMELQDFVTLVTQGSGIMDDLKILIGLLQLLSCSNIPVESLCAPTALNKKRVRKGKSKIPKYRYVNLSSPKSRSRSSTNEICMGRHMPEHFRSAHVHRWKLKDGSYRKKWLPSIIVNAGKGGSLRPRDVKVS